MYKWTFFARIDFNLEIEKLYLFEDVNNILTFSIN